MRLGCEFWIHWLYRAPMGAGSATGAEGAAAAPAGKAELIAPVGMAASAPAGIMHVRLSAKHQYISISDIAEGHGCKPPHTQVNRVASHGQRALRPTERMLGVHCC